MMILRFFAGPIVKKLTPLGLLVVSAILAIAGLVALSGAPGVAMIFGAATLYALGKDNFFWPTMLGVVSEQTPKGGALTLNAISGIGMLAVGVLGFPYIGALQANKEIASVAKLPAAAEVPGLIVDGKLAPAVLEEKNIYDVIDYKKLNGDAMDELVNSAPADKKETIGASISDARKGSAQKALFNMAIFPLIMLVAYILLFLYFKSKGGYKPINVSDH